MKRKKIVYGILLCLVLFHISCKKETAIAGSNLNTSNLINNTIYSATAQFAKEYYLSSSYYTDATATISLKINNLTNNTPISDTESFRLLVFSDPKLTNLLSIDTLNTQQGSVNATVNLKPFPNGMLTVYMQIIFADNTLLSDIVASSYKVSEFHNFSNLYTPGVQLNSPELIYPLFTSKITFTLTGLSLPAGTYDLNFLLIKTTLTNKNKISITVDSFGNSTFVITFPVFSGEFYIKIAIPYQDNYIWADSPLIKIS